MGAGADTIILHSGATLASGALLDGDAGSGSFSAGKIDTLDFAGWSGYVDGAQIANQEQVLLSDSADVTFTGANLSNANAIDGLTLQTGASAIARFASNFTVSGNFTNFGALDLSSRNGTAGTTLNIGGNYLGGGQFVIDVDFATDFSDQLLVAGNVTGTTFVAVNDVSSGSASGNNVVFASVGGTTAAGDFQLAGGPLSIGAYNYDAQLLGNQWVLGTVAAAPGAAMRSIFAAAAVPALNATAALYESTPDILLQSFAATPTYQQRVQQRQWLSYGKTAGSAFQGVWVRSAASWANITPTASSSGASYDSSSLSLQAGADFNLGDWVFGLTGQYGTVDADVSNALGTGSLRGQGFGLGATASWEGTSGSYLDVQAQANRISADLSTASTGVLLNNAEMWAYAASVEAGHRFALGANRHIVPQVQLGWGKLDAGRFVDSQSSVVDLGAPESLIGRLGVAYEVSKAGADGQGRFYAIGNLLHDFSGSRDVDLAGTPLTSRSGATWAEIGLGGAIALGGGASLFAEGSYRAALNGGPSRDAYSLSVGYRASF
jgi:outer membrane autotransporter protein